jgi:hypothetical protein
VVVFFAVHSSPPYHGKGFFAVHRRTARMQRTAVMIFPVVTRLTNSVHVAPRHISTGIASLASPHAFIDRMHPSIGSHQCTYELTSTKISGT